MTLRHILFTLAAVAFAYGLVGDAVVARLRRGREDRRTEPADPAGE